MKAFYLIDNISLTMIKEKVLIVVNNFFKCIVVRVLYRF